MVFRILGLRTDISSNLKIVKFFDTFDLDNSFRLFNKDNNIPTYINVNPNHSRSIIKQIPNAVNLIINSLSSSIRIFEYNKGPYNESLSNSSFNQGLEF